LLAQAPQRFTGQRIFHPAWGNFDEAAPSWMAKQIALAADHGIDVFLFDWYWYNGVRFLQRPLEEGFLGATNQNRLKFALMWANHDWRNYFPVPKDQPPALWFPSRASPRDFARLMDYCRHNYFSHTNYWRVNGGLYFGIFDAESFMTKLGGATATRRVFDQARAQMRSAGLGELHFGAFHGAPDGVAAFREAGFDSVTTYNVTASGRASLPDHPLDNYRDLVDHHIRFWESMDTGLLPYLPVVTLGWDPSPRWAKDAPFPPTRSDYPYGTLVISNTPTEFGRLCRLARERVEQSRIRPPAILVNAWNEWTEGSALLPNTESGTAYLEALKRSLTEH
jgi:glycosyl transferase family WbsX